MKQFSLKILYGVSHVAMLISEQPIQMKSLTERLVQEGKTELERRAREKKSFLLVMSWVQVHTALHATRTK